MKNVKIPRQWWTTETVKTGGSVAHSLFQSIFQSTALEKKNKLTKEIISIFITRWMNRNVTLCMSYRQSFYLYGFPVLQVTCVVTMPPSRTLCTGKEPIDNILIKSIHFPSSFVYPSFNRSSHTLFSCVGQTTNQSTRLDLFLNLSHYQFICS